MWLWDEHGFWWRGWRWAWCPSAGHAATVVSGDRDANGPLVVDPSGDPLDLRLDLSGSADDYLSVPEGDELAMRMAYTDMRGSHPGYINHAYGRAVHDANGQIVLQYWLFYFNQETILSAGAHQGDWEMVSVRLGGNNQPERALYAQHGSDGHSCQWSNVGHDHSSDTPDVFLAETSHASYFTAGRQGLRDVADGDGDWLIPPVTEIKSANPAWVAWPGHWGGTDSGSRSPPGPGSQPQWGAHDEWAGTVEDVCD